MLKDSFIYRHKSIVNNFFYFSILRMFNIGAKFFLVAYLVRILGEKTFGLLAWSESILQYFIIIINFGFNIYGAKYIVKYRDQKEILNSIISTIYSIKGFFLLVSFLILFLVSFVEIIGSNFNILVLLLISAVGDMLFPIWYFQGIEKLKPLTIAVAIARLLLLVGTFIFVKSPEDLYVYIYVFTACQILMGVLGFLLLKKRTNFYFIIPKLKLLKSIFSKAKLYFFGNLSMLVFNALTIFLIGVYVSMEKVAGFDISLKIVIFFLLPFEILQAVALPIITKNQSKEQLKKLTYISFLSGIIIFIALNLFPDKLLMLLGGAEIVKYTGVLRTLSLIAITVPTTFILGQCGLVAFGHDKAYNYSLITIAILYLVVVFIFIVTKSIDFSKLLYLRVFSDYLLLLFIFYHAIKNKILIKNYKTQ